MSAKPLSLSYFHSTFSTLAIILLHECLNWLLFLSLLFQGSSSYETLDGFEDVQIEYNQASMNQPIPEVSSICSKQSLSLRFQVSGPKRSYE